MGMGELRAGAAPAIHELGSTRCSQSVFYAASRRVFSFSLAVNGWASAKERFCMKGQGETIAHAEIGATVRRQARVGDSR